MTEAEFCNFVKSLFPFDSESPLDSVTLEEMNEMDDGPLKWFAMDIFDDADTNDNGVVTIDEVQKVCDEIDEQQNIETLNFKKFSIVINLICIIGLFFN
jgi:hypothetical protein